MIDCAFYGFLAADAVPGTTKNGKPWVRLRVGEGEGDTVQWLSVACFGRAAEAAALLEKGDKVYVEGKLTQSHWTGKDGVERYGLSVTAFRLEQTHKIGRNRPKREREHDDGDSRPQDEPAHDSLAW
jgi:single-stranded DNA-binding protein